MLTRQRLKEVIVTVASSSFVYQKYLRMWISSQQQQHLLRQQSLISIAIFYIRHSFVFLFSLYFTFILSGAVINICTFHFYITFSIITHHFNLLLFIVQTSYRMLMFRQATKPLDSGLDTLESFVNRHHLQLKRGSSSSKLPAKIA